MTKKTVNSEDRDLFRETIGEVRSVKSDKVFDCGQIKPKPYPKNRSVKFDACHKDIALPEIAPVGAEDELCFIAGGLHKNILVKLRQGFFSPQAEIDLHGLNSKQAKLELLQFLEDCMRAGCRCVHIVHGKGYRSQDQYPILKNNINLWLRQHHDVQAFCSAPARDGGSGAVYVLLRW